ncbi:hypothetical protein LV716_10855 [Flagellimonas sp. HMM57]|uniref:endo-beta-N-acetylglucosaminidase n=1 Tax=unclassified Flagellimonas TaxID=2644544 RepID=UPI0013D69E99|nr:MULTISPECIES: hypothetical protein [unclassified Flagellimonas]UII74763.1 hypothetical protein LV716_10855 [Flagellimonas sp. HMM57]
MRFLFLYSVLFFFAHLGNSQETKYGENQPYASHWFVEELLEWSPEKDPHYRFNKSHIPLADRFLNDSVAIDESTYIPGIMSLIAPYPTNGHPAQGFSSVKQYAFSFWQYLDYFVQWGGSAGEGIILAPLPTWTDAAHKNGVKVIGTVFFPPNVYGGKEEWVYQFLQQREDGGFPVADKLIEVANTYHFEGWFINQETYNLKRGTAERMLNFLRYFKKKTDLKIVWYDAMIEDSRVIWQDELNNHNDLFFQDDDQVMSDAFFINFRYNPTNLEDSKKLAKKLGRSEWNLYAGIDVGAKSSQTDIQWDALFSENGAKNTSLGLFSPHTTFNLSKTKEPEEVYENEQKFWNGGPTYENPYGTQKWQGFTNFFEPRSVIDKLPFVTNFNYGLGRFYKEKGKVVSSKEWHNLSIQDILPTWQWEVDSTKAAINFSFKDSYEGGSSILIESKGEAEIPLYKTHILLNKAVTFSVVAKSENGLPMEFFYELSNGEKLGYALKNSEKWKKTSITILPRPNISIVKMGIQIKGSGTGYLGEITAFHKREPKLPAPKFTVELFSNGSMAEVYLSFKDSNAAFQNIYALSKNKRKIWLGKTPSTDYYIPSVPIEDNGIHIMVEPVAQDGTKGKSSAKKIQVEQ